MRSKLSIATALIVGAGIAAGSASGAGQKTVTIKNIDFTPATVTIQHGGAVVWKWADRGVSHNVTSRGKARFHSSSTRLTGTYRVVFRRAGTYRYVCTIHANMRGKVVVR